MEEFVSAEQQESTGESHEMSMESLLDIPVEISVEIGRTRMAIGELLSLTRGSVVELNRLAGESADIYVNDKLVGKGEIVVANERLGVRVLEIVTPKGKGTEARIMENIYLSTIKMLLVLAAIVAGILRPLPLFRKTEAETAGKTSGCKRSRPSIWDIGNSCRSWR